MAAIGGSGSSAAGTVAGLPVAAAVFEDVCAAYGVLRAFSWHLKLSPFSLEDLAAGVAAAWS